MAETLEAIRLVRGELDVADLDVVVVPEPRVVGVRPGGAGLVEKLELRRVLACFHGVHSTWQFT